jgi:pimeloyl-ACP methyl ester carboxylesterase
LVAALLGPVAPAVTGKTRDALVEELLVPLGGVPLGLLEWGAGIYFRWKERNRRDLYDSHATKVTDILHYQVRGHAIRDFIERRITDVSAGDGSITLLCHSLGGIAAVDLLVKKPIPAVRQLITVGSQAGFLYESNCLWSLEYGQPLPEHFPPWRNIYDPADFLSYRASDVFAPRASDFIVDNKQPFPQAHTAYWDNPQVIDEIKRRL